MNTLYNENKKTSGSVTDRQTDRQPDSSTVSVGQSAVAVSINPMTKQKAAPLALTAHILTRCQQDGSPANCEVSTRLILHQTNDTPIHRALNFISNTPPPYTHVIWGHSQILK
jgi:hypothetical protein